MIAVAATGYDVIDLDACKERGITVSNIRNYAINTVPEHTFALIFALRRSLIPYRQSVVDGRWQQSGMFCYFDYPDCRSGRFHAWHHWRRRTRQGGRRHRAGDGDEGAVLDLQGRRGHGAALHALRGRAAAERHHHAAYAADAIHAQLDRSAPISH